MNIYGYIAILYCNDEFGWRTVTDILRLERRKGSLFWVYETSRRPRPSEFHITTWHVLDNQSDFYIKEKTSDRYLSLFPFEEHHIERIWCRDELKG